MRFFIGVMLTLMATFSVAEVSIKLNNQQYRFQQPVRLSQVLSIVADNQSWYWPASGFFRLDESVEPQRAEVLNLIDQLAMELEPSDERAMGLQALRQQVESWKLAKRIQRPVNYDLARVNMAHNPKLLDGNYLISLTPRPNMVYLSGLVKTPGPYQHLAGANVHQYIQNIKLRDDAEPDFVYVITPAGRVQKIETAYWNREYVQLMPKSQLYVPIFSYLLTPSLSELNQKVAELAVHRVL